METDIRNDHWLNFRLSRRALGSGAIVAATAAKRVRAQSTDLLFSAPMGIEGEIPGNHCVIRHGYQCENVTYNPGWWHTGENWYLDQDESAGALIYAVADGRVVFTGSEYPGRVVIIEHEDGLFSMYGHLDYDLPIAEGEEVQRGQVIGTVLFRTDGRSPSHLHFEMRTFLENPEVNGEFPRYDYSCGYHCSPGPGYWPMEDAQMPAEMGWRNPLHVLNNRALAEDYSGGLQAIVATPLVSALIHLRSEPGANAETTAEFTVKAGDRFDLVSIHAGEEATLATGAAAYEVWYELATPEDGRGWVQAVVPWPDWREGAGDVVGLMFRLHLDV